MCGGEGGDPHLRNAASILGHISALRKSWLRPISIHILFLSPLGHHPISPHPLASPSREGFGGVQASQITKIIAARNLAKGERKTLDASTVGAPCQGGRRAEHEKEGEGRA